MNRYINLIQGSPSGFGEPRNIVARRGRKIKVEYTRDNESGPMNFHEI
jgi:hypothetical protein